MLRVPFSQVLFPQPNNRWRANLMCQLMMPMDLPNMPKIVPVTLI